MSEAAKKRFARLREKASKINLSRAVRLALTVFGWKDTPSFFKWLRKEPLETFRHKNTEPLRNGPPAYIGQPADAWYFTKGTKWGYLSFVEPPNDGKPWYVKSLKPNDRRDPRKDTAMFAAFEDAERSKQ